MSSSSTDHEHAELDEEEIEGPSGDEPSDAEPDAASSARHGEGPRIGVHDRTHLEFTLDYPLRDDARTETFQWEAYFFTPESLRVSSRTYHKQDVYADLQSYVRFAVPQIAFTALPHAPLARLRRAVEAGEATTVLREMRLFACIVRASSNDARRTVLPRRSRPSFLPQPASPEALEPSELDELVEAAGEIRTALREVLAPALTMPEPVATAARWVDEDVSRIIESLLANVALDLRDADADPALVARIEQAAVREAAYRVEVGLDGVAKIGMRTRQYEHLEYRRHVLKRFSSTVLWLEPQVKSATTWVVHFFYSIAASVAMAFAAAAALWGPANGFGTNEPFIGIELFEWIVVVILAYAAKDRIKALLQSLFSNVIAKHFPDRDWRILDAKKKHEFATMEERSGFVAQGSLPEAVLTIRRLTRVSELEEEARPETVLFHKKKVIVKRALVREHEPDFDAITEIFRIDVRRWLLHTDEPKRRFAFADPDAGVVDRASAPRVYNVSIVYRLARVGDTSEDAPYRRVRVVVTRKGIRRIEPIA